MKRKIRIIIDIAMIGILLMLMAYSLIGEQFHEVIGTVMFVLFIVHHVLNRKWYAALPKGKYPARRVFQTVLDCVLLILMILQPVSGIMMSKHLYTFLPALPVSAIAREIHLPAAFWSFVLMSLHAGTHLPSLFALSGKGKKGVRNTVIVAAGVISVYGIFAFLKRGFAGYMSAKTPFAFFDYSELRVFFFLDYMAVMVLFAAAGWLIMSILKQGIGRTGGEIKGR